MKTAIRVYTKEQSAFVQELAFAAGWKWINGEHTVSLYDDHHYYIFFGGEYMHYHAQEGNHVKIYDNILDWYENQTEIEAFFKQKKTCPECGGRLDTKCDHICEKKVPFRKVGSDFVDWEDDGFWVVDAPSPTSILRNKIGKVTKKMIRDAYLYYFNGALP